MEEFPLKIKKNLVKYKFKQLIFHYCNVWALYLKTFWCSSKYFVLLSYKLFCSSKSHHFVLFIKMCILEGPLNINRFWWNFVNPLFIAIEMGKSCGRMKFRKKCFLERSNVHGQTSCLSSLTCPRALNLKSKKKKNPKFNFAIFSKWICLWTDHLHFWVDLPEGSHLKKKKNSKNIKNIFSQI